jgi:hypothetical protein
MPEPARSRASAVPLNHARPNALIGLVLSDDQYTHILFAACIAAGLIYLDRSKIFGNVHYCRRPCGIAQIAPSISASGYYSFSPLELGALVVLGRRSETSRLTRSSPEMPEYQANGAGFP